MLSPYICPFDQRHSRLTGDTFAFSVSLMGDGATAAGSLSTICRDVGLHGEIQKALQHKQEQKCAQNQKLGNTHGPSVEPWIEKVQCSCSCVCGMKGVFVRKPARVDTDRHFFIKYRKEMKTRRSFSEKLSPLTYLSSWYLL